MIRRIDFKFSNLMHSALVSISGNDDEMFVHIQLVDSFIKKVFGVEHIRFLRNREEIKMGSSKHQFMYEVAQIITHKLDEELEKETPELKAV